MMHKTNILPFKFVYNPHTQEEWLTDEDMTLKPEEKLNPLEHWAFFFPFIRRDLGNFRGQHNSSSITEFSKDLSTSAKK